jgi:CheY-like chemotaxis protein
MKGLKVLLVDDEIEFITTLSERLVLRGIHAAMATDGESALRRIEKDPPDVVIMDLLMPGINGLELLKQIGARNSDVSVILLSGR